MSQAWEQVHHEVSFSDHPCRIFLEIATQSLAVWCLCFSSLWHLWRWAGFKLSTGPYQLYDLGEGSETSCGLSFPICKMEMTKLPFDRFPRLSNPPNNPQGKYNHHHFEDGEPEA